MNHKEYNGWHNYETWLVNLWIDNEQSSQAYWAEEAKRAWDAFSDLELENRKDEAMLCLAESIHTHFDEGNPCQDNGFWTDLIGAALSEVNWHEIASNMLEEIAREEAEEA